MGTITLLMRRSARTSRGLLVATLLLSTLASVLLTLGHQALFDFPRAVDEQYARLASEDVQINSLNPRLAAAIAAEAKKHAGVAQADFEQALVQYASYDFGGSEQTSVVVYLDEASAPALGRSRIVEHGPAVDAPAYLPAVFKQAGGYGLGDTFTVKSSGHGDQVFHVAGYFENTNYGTITMGQTALLLPHQEFLARAARGAVPQATVTRLRLDDPDQADKVSNEIVQRASAHPEKLGLPMHHQVSTAQMIRPSYTIDAKLYAVVLLGFSIVITLVAMTVIAFLVRAAVARDMVAIGVQKAIGLGSGAVMVGTFAPVVAASLAGVLLGTLGAQAALPWLAGVQNGDSGLDWQPGFSATAFLLCKSVVVGGCLLAAALATLGIRRVVPVDALRGGTAGHSFGSSILPLASTPGPLSLLAGAKQAWASMGQSIAVVCVTGVVCFTSVFATTFGSDTLGNIETLRFMSVGEMEDLSMAIADVSERDQIRDEVAARPGVQNAFFADWMPMQVGDRNVTASVLDDYSVHQHSVVHQGREPIHANEVAIGDKVATAAGVDVGDQIGLSDGDRSADYLVVGRLSSVQYYGMRIDLTTRGYQRLVPGFVSDQLAIHLASDQAADADTMTDQLRHDYGSRVRFVQNVRGITDGVLGGYITVLRGLGTGMQVLGWGLVALVISLLVRSALVAQRQAMGVRKALGATTGDLVGLVLATHLPTLVVGAVLGGVVGWFASLPLVGAIVSAAGVSHLDLAMRPGKVVLACAATVLIALVLVLVESLRLRKVSAYDLFRE